MVLACTLQMRRRRLTALGILVSVASGCYQVTEQDAALPGPDLAGVAGGGADRSVQRAEPSAPSAASTASGATPVPSNADSSRPAPASMSRQLQDCAPGAFSSPGTVDDPCGAQASCAPGDAALARCLPDGTWSTCSCVLSVPPPPPPEPPPATNPMEPRTRVDECIDTMTELYPVGNAEAGTCACERCLEVVATCFEDPACFRIFDCATRVGCFSVECYTPETCMSVIDASGIGSPPVATVMALGDCLNAAGCPRAEPPVAF